MPARWITAVAIGGCLAFFAYAAPRPAMGQTSAWPPPDTRRSDDGRRYGPDQPVDPRMPGFDRRPAAPGDYPSTGGYSGGTTSPGVYPAMPPRAGTPSAGSTYPSTGAPVGTGVSAPPGYTPVAPGARVGNPVPPEPSGAGLRAPGTPSTGAGAIGSASARAGATGSASAAPVGTNAPPAPPFTLTPQQQAEVNRVLTLWEQKTSYIKTFDCQFKRWEYLVTFSKPNPAAPPDAAPAPTHEDLGVIRYEAPDKGLFQIASTVENGQTKPIEPTRADHWVCNGKSIFQFDYNLKRLTEFELPPGRQGKAIATEGPLPFIFGAKADDLRQRYYIRIITPKEAQGQQTWLEVFPKYQRDAANFRRLHLVLNNQTMMPFAMQFLQTNARDYTSYQFYNAVVNDPGRWLKIGDPFKAVAPRGWEKQVQQMDNQAVRPAPRR